MCGRFTRKYTWQQLYQLMMLTTPPDSEELEPSFNVAPTQSSPVVRLDSHGRRTASMLRWGLIPSWAKDESIGARCVNARSEEAASKPAFREAFRRRRCLVPISSFYEWQPLEGERHKQPWSIGVRGTPLFALGGLWEHWEHAGQPIETFTILTRAPNEFMAAMHSRMPVIVRPEHYDLWLDPKRERPEELAPALEPFPSGAMEAHRVGRRVNSIANNDPSLLDEVPAEPGGLFGP